MNQPAGNRRLDPSRRSRRSVSVVLLACLMLASTWAVPPAGASQAVVAQAQQTDWYVNDDPAYRGAWRAGHHAREGYGYGVARYWGGSNYAYAMQLGGQEPTGSWARWPMGTRIGEQEISAFIPHTHATARVRYHVTVKSSDGSSRVTSPRINQLDIRGWHSLGTYRTDGDVTVELFYDDSLPASGRSGPTARMVGMDAIRMRCVSDCSTQSDQPTSTQSDRPTAVRNLSVARAEDKFRITWDPPADAGSSPLDTLEMSVSRPAAGGKGPWSHTYEWSASVTALNFTPSYPAVRYSFTLVAVNRDGKRSPGETVAATLQPPDGRLGQAEITSLVQHKSRNPLDRHDAVTVAWNKVNGASGYEVAYWYREPYGDTIERDPNELFVTVDEMIKRGELICETQPRFRTELPCEPKQIFTVSGGDNTSYETPQLPDHLIPVRLEVAVRAITSTTQGPWSASRSIPEQRCGRTIDLSDLGKLAILIRLMDRVPSWASGAVRALTSAVNVIDRVLNNCQSVRDAIIDEVIDKIPFIKDFLNWYEKTKCNLSVLDQVIAREVTGRHPTNVPYIQCGVVYDIDDRVDYEYEEYPFE